MAERTVLAGNYRVANEPSLRARMESLQGDPRFQFYQAMFATDSYDAYLDTVGKTKVEIENFKMGPISGRAEILYARRRGWIQDAGSATQTKPSAGLKNITAEAVRRAVAEFDEITRDAFLKRYGFGRSREYFLVVQGKRYDSKAIVGAAHQYVAAAGNPLPAKKFSGGDKTVRRILESLDFQVEKVAEAVQVPNFERGRIYNRRSDIHAVYGGQQQGGIATPTEPFIFLFTGQQGATYGYQDGMRADGIFEYTGEGQTGEMKFVRGNKAIRDHAANGKDLLLFETLKTKGKCRYLGSFVCDDWEPRKSKDKAGVSRSVIVFHLVPIENVEAEQSKITQAPGPKAPLEDLRQQAYASAASEGPGPGTGRRNVYIRSRDVRDYVLARANGICECCKSPAPFKRTNGTPYLEPHHTRRVSDGGPDHPRWVGAICPTCHRHIHHGANGAQINEDLQKHLGQLEGEGSVAGEGQ